MDHEHIDAFLAETTTSFHFLETDYGYQLLERVMKDLNHFQDAAASVSYVSSHVGVKVGWGIADGFIGVSFTELLQPGTFPASSSPFPFKNQPYTAKSIGLYTLAAMQGHAEDPDFLLKKIYSFRTRKRRIKTIESKMPEVLAGLARATRKYASSILQGDTSLFPKVMQFFVEEQKKYYPYIPLPPGLVDDPS